MIHNTTLNRTLAVAALVFVFALGALADTRAPANIPFDFEFRGQSFTAGRYEVTAGQGFTIVSLTAPDGRQHASLSTPIGNPNSPSPSRLVFRYDGETYQLAEIWLHGAGGKKIQTKTRTPAMTSQHATPRLVEISIGD
jgi:hypothetical protein